MSVTQPGLYCIANIENNKKYYGSSVNLGQRFKLHRYQLRTNTHGNKHLQRAWNQYGETAFEFIIILGKKHSVEHKRRISQSMKDNQHLRGKRLSPETRAKMAIAQRNRRKV